MRISSPSRRRLLTRAVGAVFCAETLPAGVLELLPGFQRKDPRIRTLTYRHADAIALDGRSIAVRPFPSQQAGKPAPPDFAPFIGRSLAWAYPDSTVHLEADSAADIVIEGRVDLFHRLGAQGLRIAISAVVYDVSSGEEFVLWNGAKKADWVRRFSTDDCLLLLADDFVATWGGA